MVKNNDFIYRFLGEGRLETLNTIDFGVASLLWLGTVCFIPDPMACLLFDTSLDYHPLLF